VKEEEEEEEAEDSAQDDGENSEQSAADDDDTQDRIQAVENTFTAIERGLPTTGQPKLAEYICKDVVDKLCECMGLSKEILS
jgi:hypothetical protein